MNCFLKIESLAIEALFLFYILNGGIGMFIETKDGRTLGDFPRGRNGNNEMFKTIMDSGERIVAIGYKYEE